MLQMRYDAYELPPPGNMMGKGEEGREIFKKQGTEISGNVFDALSPHVPNLASGTLNVLDFGCGSGRVALPLYHQYRFPTAAVDVSPKATEYLGNTLKNVQVRKTEYLPPLPFADASFDAIYSISVWTHLPLDLQWPWLREMNRLLKMGGVALITTSGYRALRYRRDQRQQDGWRGVTDDDLRLEGVIYKPVDPTWHDGIEGEYGYVAHDPAWVRREWGRLFDVIEQKESGVAKMQDINLLRKVRDVAPSDLTLLNKWRRP